MTRCTSAPATGALAPLSTLTTIEPDGGEVTGICTTVVVFATHGCTPRGEEVEREVVHRGVEFIAGGQTREHSSPVGACRQEARPAEQDGIRNRIAGHVVDHFELDIAVAQGRDDDRDVRRIAEDVDRLRCVLVVDRTRLGDDDIAWPGPDPANAATPLASVSSTAKKSTLTCTPTTGSPSGSSTVMLTSTSTGATRLIVAVTVELATMVAVVDPLPSEKSSTASVTGPAGTPKSVA